MSTGCSAQTHKSRYLPGNSLPHEWAVTLTVIQRPQVRNAGESMQVKHTLPDNINFAPDKKTIYFAAAFLHKHFFITVHSLFKG